MAFNYIRAGLMAIFCRGGTAINSGPESSARALVSAEGSRADQPLRRVMMSLFFAAVSVKPALLQMNAARECVFATTPCYLGNQCSGRR